MWMSEMKRAHPLSIFAGFFKELKQLLLPIIIGALFGIRHDDGMSEWFALFGIGICLFFAVIEWWRTRYQVLEDQLYVKIGTIFMKERFIRFERIQSLHLSTNPFLKLFGLVRLEVHTAGGEDKAEFALSAVKRDEALRLQERIGGSNRSSQEDLLAVLDRSENSERVYRLRGGELVLAALTSSGARVIFLGLFTLLGQIGELWERVSFITPLRREFHRVIGVPLLEAAAGVAAVLLIFWLLSSAIAFVKMYRFTLTVREKDWVIRRGFFEQTEQIVPFKRVQAVKIRENWLKQSFGYASVYLDVAGGQAGDGASEVLLYPLIRKERVAEFLAAIRSPFPWAVPTAAVSIRAFYWKIIKYVVPLAVLATILSLWVPYGAWSWLLVAASMALSWLGYRDASFAVDGDRVALGRREFSKETILTERKRLQFLSCRVSPVQKRLKLMTVQSGLIAGNNGYSFRICDLPLAEGRRLYEWYITAYTRSARRELQRVDGESSYSL